MTTSDALLPIGVFARACGLTPTALRFYARVALFSPAHVDVVAEDHGYTFEQVPRAITLRRARDLGMPLVDMRAVAATTPTEAERLIAEYAAHVNRGDIRGRREHV